VEFFVCVAQFQGWRGVRAYLSLVKEKKSNTRTLQKGIWGTTWCFLSRASDGKVASLTHYLSLVQSVFEKISTTLLLGEKS
jgi:hypothetical protein